ncbi:MAG: isocitrate/isopropylmalate dehydrogenase family protein [Firmicutes bacterium]|nr:isocitrate/isopropylmalate dehydrogenase family protein [Bacillota bacterium]
MILKNREEDIKAAVKDFEKLLREQLDRADKMSSEKSSGKASDSATVIGLIDGDGIGPIIMKEARKLLEIMLSDEINAGKVILRDIKGLTIGNRKAQGKSVPDDVLDEIKSCDVLLKGPTETPKGGTMESANVTLRRELDLYANVRPVAVPELGIDWTFFRENTEGEYVLGSRGIKIGEDLTMDFKVITEAGTERIARAAFDFAKKNNKDRVAIVTKANIMKKTDGMFSEVCNRVAEEYEGIKAEDWYVDIMAANLVNPSIRSGFQVFLLPNLYGDIITDEAAEIQGGVGTGGSANIGDRYAMFEAIHGTAPRMIEDSLQDYVNPMSIFKACEMMLRHLGMAEKADKLRSALDKALSSECPYKVSGFPDGSTCAELTGYVFSQLA